MTTAKDTFITIQARLALYVIIVIGSAALIAGTAYQACALDRQMERAVRV